ncbi:hypothetical protein BH24CHL1_BH24CHL1_15230 [soil metagenome]
MHKGLQTWLIRFGSVVLKAPLAHDRDQFVGEYFELHADHAFAGWLAVWICGFDFRPCMGFDETFVLEDFPVLFQYIVDGNFFMLQAYQLMPSPLAIHCRRFARNGLR